MSSTREIYSDLRKSRGASAAAALVGEGEACEGDQNAKEQARRREPRWYVRERERACVCVKCAGVSTRRGRGMEGSRGRGRSAERRDPAGVPPALATVFARSVGSFQPLRGWSGGVPSGPSRVSGRVAPDSRRCPRASPDPQLAVRRAALSPLETFASFSRPDSLLSLFFPSEHRSQSRFTRSRTSC